MTKKKQISLFIIIFFGHNFNLLQVPFPKSLR